MPAGLLMLLRTEEEREQFAQFYRQYESLMFQTARRFLDSQEDCEDAVQSSCAYLIDHFDKFSAYGTRQALSYLLLLIRSRSKDLRDRRQRTAHEDIEMFADRLTEQPEVDIELSLSQAFDLLPDHYKETLVLRYYNDLPVKEIAGLLQLSEAVVKKRLQRARDTLRDLMTDEGGADA